MKLLLSIFLIFMVTYGYAQDITSNYRQKILSLKDTVVLDTVSINPKHFAIYDKEGNSPNPFSYLMDFKK